MKTRICNVCGRELELLLGFYKNGTHGDTQRYTFTCKECFKKSLKLNYRPRNRKEYYHSQEYKAINAAKAKRYNERNPLKVNARKLSLKIPRKNKCEKCSNTKKLEKHHKDYNKPFELVTLCRSCHLKEHYNSHHPRQEGRGEYESRR